MSYRKIAMLSVALPLALACAVHAQTPAAPPRSPHDRDGAAQRTPDPPPPPTEALRRALALDDAQTRALDGVMRRHHEQMTQLHEQMREQRERIDRQTDAEVRKLLGEQRFAQFRQWMSEHRPPPPGPMGDGRRGDGPARGGGRPGGWGPPPGGRDGPDGPPPPPPED